MNVKFQAWIFLFILLLQCSMQFETNSMNHKATGYSRRANLKRQQIRPNRIPKDDGGNTLYTLQIAMDNQNVIDFLVANSYGENSYIRDNFGIQNFEIKIVSIQRLLDKAEPAQLDAALNDLKVDYNDFKDTYISYHPTYNKLTMLRIFPGAAVDNFLSNLNNDSEALVKILKLVNIDPDDFQDTVMNKSEEDFFNLLATGNYAKENVKSVLEIANVEPTFGNIVKTLGLTKEFVTQFALNFESDFVPIMKSLQVTSNNLKAAFKNFNIKDSSEPKEITPMPALLEKLSGLETITVQITEYKTVTYKNSAVIKEYKKIAPYAKILGTNLGDNRKVELIPNSLNPTDASYATLWSEDTMGPKLTPLAMTDEIQSKPDYSDCSYLLVRGKTVRQIKVTPILYNRNFHVIKPDSQQVLIDGTPMVCFEKLYGVAYNDFAGNTNVTFVSKYPIMKRVADDDSGGGIFGWFIRMFNKLIKTIKNFFKNMFRRIPPFSWICSD